MVWVTQEEEVGGMPSLGSSPASRPVCLGAVEVEADGPVLTAVPVLPPVLQRMHLLQHIFGLPVTIRWHGV